MNDKQRERVFKRIDNKFDKMTEEELEEYERQQQMRIQKYGGKKLDQYKRMGWESKVKKSERP